MKTIFGFILAALVLIGCAAPGAKSPGREELAASLVTKTVSLVMQPDPIEAEVSAAFGLPPPEAHVYCSGSWVSATEILTADHCTLDAAIGESLSYVVEGDVTTLLDGQTVINARAAKLVYRDNPHDLALLKTYAAPASHGIAVVSPDEPGLGQSVHTMGAPMGLGWSYSSGQVAQIRFVFEDGQGYWYVQTTAPLSPGSSGCGLFDDFGRLLGVARMQMRRGQNLNFFVHRDHVAAFLLNAHAGKKS